MKDTNVISFLSFVLIYAFSAFNAFHPIIIYHQGAFEPIIIMNSAQRLPRKVILGCDIAITCLQN